jgi:uncharacterized protein (DUF1330 family)
VNAAYAIAHVHSIEFGPDVAEYLRRIDATLTPFEGRFLVHGPQPEKVEGDWQGDLIVIAFPSMTAARGWYDSPAYREILPLRLDHSVVDTILVEGVAEGYQAASVLKYLLPAEA